MNSAKTSTQIRINVYFSFRQFDGSVVLQNRSLPWHCIPNMWDTLIQDQFLLNVEQLLYFSKSVFSVVRRLSWWSFPRWIAASKTADIQIHQNIAVTSMSNVSSPCWRFSFCRPHEQIRSRWPTFFLDFFKLEWDNFVSLGLSFPPRVSPYWCSSLHLDATHDNAMLCYQSNISQRVSTYRYGPNMNFVFWASPSCKMHSNQIPLETNRQSSTPNSSLVSDYSTTRVSSCISLFLICSEGRWLSWNG